MLFLGLCKCTRHSERSEVSAFRRPYGGFNFVRNDSSMSSSHFYVINVCGGDSSKTSSAAKHAVKVVVSADPKPYPCAVRFFRADGTITQSNPGFPYIYLAFDRLELQARMFFIVSP